MAIPYAFVSLITSDSYLPGALALAAALNDIHPNPPTPPLLPFQTVCLVTPETVDVATIRLLRKAFNTVIGVEIIEQKDYNGLRLLGRLDLHTVLTKLHIFRLTQFAKIIFLDADVLPLRPLSHLFALPHDFAAVPDVGWPDIFNSGVLVFNPGEDKFNEVMHLLNTKGSWDGGDQGILNEWRGNNWHRLSFIYNTTPTAAYTYAPAYERFGSQISAVHFIGPNKPWKSLPYRPPFIKFSTAESPEQAYDYNTLLDSWFSVYDKHYRSQPLVEDSSFEVKKYVAAWEDQQNTSSSIHVPLPGSVLSLEELKKVALEGLHSVTALSDTRSGEGDYLNLPLQGRVDLMRPKKPEVLKIAEPQEESLPSTPIRAQNRGTPIIWQTLPTPEPSDLPPSPHPMPISLPPTPTPHFWLHKDPSPVPVPNSEHTMEQSTAQASESEPSKTDDFGRLEHSGFIQASLDPKPELSGLENRKDERRDSISNDHVVKEEHDEKEKRPPSPPLLLWNPAIEPPPRTAPSSTAFPADTYFPNVWDQALEHAPSTPGRTGQVQLFQPLPTPEIPKPLVQQGHYRNVTGDSVLGASPIPNPAKVKHIFPWEDKPRATPGRVFPPSDFSSPMQHLSPAPPKSPTVTGSAGPVAPLSPLRGLPVNLAYSNAWDTVPSIQRYASKLARPSHAAALGPAFDEEKGKGRDAKSEISSRDGDDEDDGNESSMDDSDKESLAKSSRRSSVVSASELITGKKKHYKTRGIQTIPREKRNQAVQVSTLLPMGNTTAPKNSNRHPLESTFDDVSFQPDLPMTTAVPSPVGEPELLLPSHLPHAIGQRPSSPFKANQGQNTFNVPQLPTRLSTLRSPAIASRQISNDSSSLASPLSSGPPLSPVDAPAVNPPVRKGGRVWDPARGVELFKRGSEEVLARFLKMGSWEEDASRSPR
ncbi:glycosyltransferase family 8 protein [Amanita thiersii Skay4041]|uniref:glycogenin glucosyltransferase n=1 Tax=Amanita thiersii Skay4041 TaxID=703135 RepID=A0A2A9P179_9AGAR|nr:glycosyltransferase family 8 protein [Amanita thiersii Skay4041]